MQSKEELFKERFAAVMTDVRDAETNPREMAMLGSLADRLISAAGQPNWSVFKAKMTKKDFDKLLQSFQDQGNSLARQGSMSQMRIIEVLACSLIARTQATDKDVLVEDVALNRIIDEAVRNYRANPSFS